MKLERRNGRTSNHHLLCLLCLSFILFTNRVSSAPKGDWGISIPLAYSESGQYEFSSQTFSRPARVLQPASFLVDTHNGDRKTEFKEWMSMQVGWLWIVPVALISLLTGMALGKRMAVRWLRDLRCRTIESHCAFKQLTTREREVLELLLLGKSNREIEERLFISIRTVKNHVYNIYRKVGVRNRMQLMARFQPGAVHEKQSTARDPVYPKKVGAARECS